MAKSRSFSFFLLKNEYNPTNCLKDTHSLKKITTNHTKLPKGAIMYIADKPEQSPWWKEYWGLSQSLKQAYKSALIFIPIKDQWIALTFGHIYHQLKTTSYEYDFGLKITLNALDPSKIKSTDLLQPENAKRQKIQLPIGSTLTYFDFANNESIIKRLTGFVKDEYNDLFKQVTGAHNLRISTKAQPNEIIDLGKTLIEIYNKQDYQKHFPDINNIVPIKDPELIEILENKLVEAFNNKNDKVVLVIPEMFDDSKLLQVDFRGCGKSNKIFDDVYIDAYRSYLIEKGNKAAKGTIDAFKKHTMRLINEDRVCIKKYSIYNSLLFDCKYKQEHYHLCDGAWYYIEKDYIDELNKKISTYILPKYNVLPAFKNKGEREESYNNYVAANNQNIICLDQKDISPTGQSKIEPCDLITIHKEEIHLIHIKKSTLSATLSHLFNQGLNSLEMLKLEKESKDKLKSLIKNKTNKIKDYEKMIYENKFHIIYGIITKKAVKNSEKTVENFPIFSRISLYRTLKAFQLMSTPCHIYFIPDESLTIT